MKAKSAYLFKDRKWPRFEIIYTNGKRKRFTKHVDIETAELILTKIRNRIGIGTFELEDFTVERDILVRLGTASAEYIKMREQEEKLENISKKTLENDYYALKLLVRELGKDRIMLRIRKEDIQQMKYVLMTKRTTQHGKHYTSGGVTSYLRHISGFMTYCKEKGYLKENPVKGLIEAGKRGDREKEIRFLTEEEIEILREYFSKQKDWQLDAFNFALWTSARVAEVINLRRQDYFDKGIDRKIIRLFGKRNKERYIPIQEKANELILKRISWLSNYDKMREKIIHINKREQREKYEKRWKDGYLFFEVETKGAVSHAFRKAKLACGLRENITFHSARHTFATDILRQGTDVLTVAAVLGHADTRMTQHYAKIVEETLVKNMSKTREM